MAHSMGGLLINYALLKAQHDQPDFPVVLYVGQVITMGTPHTGTDKSCGYFPELVFQAAQMCNNPTWEPAAASFLPWLANYGQDPQGSMYPEMRTEWTLMGAIEDEWVPERSATGLPIPPDCSPYVRGCDWVRHPSHWVEMRWAPTAITNMKHGDYNQDTSGLTDRWARWRHRGGDIQGPSDGHWHAVMWAHRALSTTDW